MVAGFPKQVGVGAAAVGGMAALKPTPSKRIAIARRTVVLSLCSSPKETHRSHQTLQDLGSSWSRGPELLRVQRARCRLFAWSALAVRCDFADTPVCSVAAIDGINVLSALEFVVPGAPIKRVVAGCAE